MIIIYGVEGTALARTLVTEALGPTGWQFAPKGENVLSPSAGNVVVVMGAAAFKDYQQAGVYAKNRALTSMREKPQRFGGGFVLCTFSPALTYSDAAAAATIKWDLELARRLEKNGNTDAIIGAYEWVPTAQDLLALVQRMIAEGAQKPGGIPATFDTETMGLVPFEPDKKIVTVQLTNCAGKGWAFHLSDIRTEEDEEAFRLALDLYLNAPKLKMRGANLKYDLIWVRVEYGITCSNFKMDTLLVGSILNEERSNGLSWHTKEHVPPLGGYDLAFDAKYDKGEMEKVPKDDPLFLTYAAGDVDACYQVSEVQVGELMRQPELARFYVNLLHPAARAFEEIEFHGVEADVGKFHALEKELLEEIETTHTAALRMLPRTLQMRHLGALELSRPKLIHDFLFTDMGLNLKPLKTTGKTGAPSTDRAHLQLLMNAPNAKPETVEFINALFLWKNASKMLSTYVYGFLKHLRADGKFHPTYFLFNGEGEDDDDAGGTLCVTEHTIFNSSRGACKFHELQIGDSVLTHEGVARKITWKVDNGVKPVVEVRLADGRKLTCTKNHPIMTADGWVDAGNLQPGVAVSVYGAPEEWRRIPEWPYSISSWGRIRSDTIAQLKQRPKGKWGHLKVTLKRNGSQGRDGDTKDFAVHRLVAEIFGAPGDGPEVRHLNGIAWDNNIANLCWGTVQENRTDMAEHCSAIGAHERKLSDEQVAWLRSEESKGVNHTQAAASFGVSRRLVAMIRKGERRPDKAPINTRAEFSWSAVEAVVDCGEQKTFGIEVEEHHSHVTNGIVSHNTGRLTCLAPPMQVIPKHAKKGMKNWAKLIRQCFPAPPGYVFFECVAPESRVLTADLRWVRADSVKTGDKLMGFDESIPGKWKERCLREAAVTAVKQFPTKRLRVRFESGREVVCSYDHKWLVNPRAKGKPPAKLVWRRADELGVGSEIRRVVDPWGEPRSFDDGWLSGIIDGEGYLNNGSGIQLGVAQADGPVWDKMLRLFNEHSERVTTDTSWRAAKNSKHQNLNVLRICNMQDTLKIIGSLRPVRMLAKSEQWFGKALPRSGYDTVVSVEAVEDGPVVAIATSTKTLVVEGLASHNCDFSQGELRVVACVANETNMINAYQKGMDLHCLTGAGAAGMPYEEFMAAEKRRKAKDKTLDPALAALVERFRQQAKSANFGLLYGMGAAGFRIYARDVYGVTLTEREAEITREAFFKTYPGLPKYHEAAKAYARKHLEVVSPLGRVRHLKLIKSMDNETRAYTERQALNSPIQSTLSDMCLWSISIIQRELAGEGVRMCGMTHDSIYGYLKEDRAAELVKRCTDIMSNLPFEKLGWSPVLNFPADAKIGATMGDLEEYEIAA